MVKEKYTQKKPRDIPLKQNIQQGVKMKAEEEEEEETNKADVK